MKNRISTSLTTRAGFTLVEVLISITLLSIILGAIYTSFFTAQRAIRRFNDSTLKYHESRIALDLIRREIEGALGSNKTSFIIEDRDIFGKQASRLRLTAYSFKEAGINVISYYVQEKEGRLTLMKTTSSIIKEQDHNIEHVSEIMEGIEGFTVETLFGNKWIKTWNTDKTGFLPEVVRVTIEFDDNGKKVKLTEYARPKIGRSL
jgi:prepilin-type N-terminal cleavage/methylation domain-containing protein